jgi:hypothetical protein
MSANLLDENFFAIDTTISLYKISTKVFDYGKIKANLGGYKENYGESDY